jgi:aminoglycoside phosphotransferase (APT) family kinase protein
VATAPSDPAAAAATPEDRLAGQLRALLAGECSDPDLRVRDLRRLTGGASQETWAFDAVMADGEERPLILRRDMPAAIRGGGAMARETRAIEAAARAGVPVPTVIAKGDDTAALDAPFAVTEFVEGETVPRRILRDDAYAEARPLLAERCGEILARVHSIPPGEVEGLEAPDVLAQLRGALDYFEEGSPALELGMRWLERNRPAEGPPSVVHGDFRNGNLMVGPDGIRAVLDWELVHLGDPMQDLGYLCARCWRFGVVDRPVGGFGKYADLFRGYESVSGRPVDPDLVRWWELYSSVWWGVGCMVQASRHLSGGVRSIELAAIGRRVWEQEYDVLLYLDGRGG